MSPENWKIILKSLVNDKIWHFYLLGNGNLPWDTMHLMVLLLEAQLSKLLNTKTLWVESIEATILCKA